MSMKPDGNPMNTVDPAALRKSRMFLLLIALVFAAPMMVAGWLTYDGWQPDAKGNGQPVQPQRNFVSEKLVIQLANGQPYAWRDSEPRMTLVALAGPDCAAQCLATLTKMAAARVTLSSNMSRLRLLYLGTPPVNDQSDGIRNYWQLGADVDGKLAMYRPSAPDSVSALLVESNGTALSLYPAGFDPSGLRKDLQKVIH
jgi:cytochrome oxidase Cu insertion factor (SCO1/SenC/PrrC family)